MQKSIKVSLFITSDKKLQVKVMASEAAMTFTADSKADRKVPKIRRFSTGLVHVFGGRLMESKYGFL